MENMKSSIRTRAIFIAVVLGAWIISMFPLKNQDYFAYVSVQAEKNIVKKATEDAEDTSEAEEAEIRTSRM